MGCLCLYLVSYLESAKFTTIYKSMIYNIVFDDDDYNDEISNNINIFQVPCLTVIKRTAPLN